MSVVVRLWLSYCWSHGIVERRELLLAIVVCHNTSKILIPSDLEDFQEVFEDRLYAGRHNDPSGSRFPSSFTAMLEPGVHPPASLLLGRFAEDTYWQRQVVW